MLECIHNYPGWKLLCQFMFAQMGTTIFFDLVFVNVFLIKERKLSVHALLPMMCICIF